MFKRQYLSHWILFHHGPLDPLSPSLLAWMLKYLCTTSKQAYDVLAGGRCKVSMKRASWELNSPTVSMAPLFVVEHRRILLPNVPSEFTF
jgi:hypothetical protein